MTRKKQPVMYAIAGAGLAITFVFAIVGICFIDWLAVGMMALVSAGIYLLSTRKEDKAY